MKNLKLFFLLFVLNGILHADYTPYYSFSNIGVNYFDWTQDTHDKTSKEDFAYVSAEGGAGWKWVEVYANVNLENPTKKYSDKSPDNLRYTAYIDVDVKVAKGFRVHFQNFFLEGLDYYVNDFVLGASYKYKYDSKLWIKPFIGVHHTTDTYYKGFNGYMAGWVLDYNMNFFGENFEVFWWNELEFDRNRDFYLSDNVPVGDGKSYGLNGSMNFFWHINKSVTTGIQYRYAEHKLGSIAYQSGMVYMLKYNF